MNATRLIALLLTLGLVLSAVPVILADGESSTSARPGSQRASDAPRHEKEEENETADDDQAEDHKDAREKEGARSDDGEKGPRKPGRIVVTNGSYDGRYVDFSLDRANCTLTNYRVYNQTFFDVIRLPAPCDDAKHGGAVRGAEVEIKSAHVKLKIHDAPNGLLRFEAEDGETMFIDLGDGLISNLTKKGVELKVGNLSGLLRIDADDNESTVDFSNATAGDVSGDGRFWVHPLKGDSPERQEIRDAVKKGKVAGEIDVLVDNGTVSTQVLQYEDVIIKAGKKDNSTYRFLVDANLTEGRTFVVNLGPGVFKHDRIGIRYFDLDNTSAESEVAITEAADLQDILAIEAGEGPEYWIVKDQGGVHVLVAVPHFSVHVFEVMSLNAALAPIIVGGVVAALVVVAVAAVGVFRPRRA